MANAMHAISTLADVWIYRQGHKSMFGTRKCPDNARRTHKLAFDLTTVARIQTFDVP